MSAIQINGTIDNPEPIISHDEPQSPYNGGSLAAGVITQITLPGFKNTGNVPQTLTVAVTAADGVQVTGFNLEMNGNQYTNQVTLNPGFSALLRVNLLAPNNGPEDDTSYSLEVDTDWS